MKSNLFIPFDNSFASLPIDFYVKMNPEQMPNLKLIKFNESLSDLLGLPSKQLQGQDGIDFLGGKNILYNQEPLAQVYAGHQFGNFVPQLGDGRAILLGEVIDRIGTRYDIQLKGSGKTPFSRMGDGRSGLGPVLREYIVSEAMFAFGIPTTRALGALFTGETVVRDMPVPGALLIRVAKSHVRIGTFEYFARKGQTNKVKELADYVINRHYPDVKNGPNKYWDLLENVIKKQALLIAKWMGIGFIHGVMNTDNMTLSGETIDFGPCAFMDSFDLEKVYSSIDVQGRYRFSNQPYITVWNLSRLAETLLPLIDENQTTAIKKAEHLLETYLPLFSKHWVEIMGKKLGIKEPKAADKALIEGLLKNMQDGQSDFTQTFRKLSFLIDKNYEKEWFALFSNPRNPELKNWITKWKNRIELNDANRPVILDQLKNKNPCIIPRNHLIEKCISQALKGDLNLFHRLLKALETPYISHPEFDEFSKPPKNNEIVHQTFCGT